MDLTTIASPLGRRALRDDDGPAGGSPAAAAGFIMLLPFLCPPLPLLPPNKVLGKNLRRAEAVDDALSMDPLETSEELLFRRMKRRLLFRLDEEEGVCPDELL